MIVHQETSLYFQGSLLLPIWQKAFLLISHIFLSPCVYCEALNKRWRLVRTNTESAAYFGSILFPSHWVYEEQVFQFLSQQRLKMHYRRSLDNPPKFWVYVYFSDIKSSSAKSFIYVENLAYLMFPMSALQHLKSISLHTCFFQVKNSLSLFGGRLVTPSCHS